MDAPGPSNLADTGDQNAPVVDPNMYALLSTQFGLNMQMIHAMSISAVAPDAPDSRAATDIILALLNKHNPAAHFGRFTFERHEQPAAAPTIDAVGDGGSETAATPTANNSTARAEVEAVDQVADLPLPPPPQPPPPRNNAMVPPQRKPANRTRVKTSSSKSRIRVLPLSSDSSDEPSARLNNSPKPPKSRHRKNLNVAPGYSSMETVPETPEDVKPVVLPAAQDNQGAIIALTVRTQKLRTQEELHTIEQRLVQISETCNRLRPLDAVEFNALLDDLDRKCIN